MKTATRTLLIRSAITLPILISYSLIAMAQDSVNLDTLSENEFKVLLNREFTRVTTGQSTYMAGNYAGIDLGKTEAVINPTFIFKNNTILSATIKAGLKDGISTLRKNTEFNSGVSANIQYHFLFNQKSNYLIYDSDSKMAHDAKQRQIKESYQLDTLNARYRAAELALEVEIKKKQKKLDSLKLRLRSMGQPDSALLYAIKKCEVEIDKIQGDLAAATKSREDGDLKRQARNKSIQAERKNLRENVKVEGSGFGWLSTGYKFAYNDFKLITPGSAFADQVIDSNHADHTFNLQYSYYRMGIGALTSFYVSLRGEYGYTNNLSELDDQQVEELTQLGASGGDRQIKESYTAYLGDYKEGINQADITLDLYYFLLREPLTGVHISPKVRYKDGYRPSYDLLFGVVYEFNKKDKEGSTVNVELFYNTEDLTENEPSELEFYERGQLGLRFNFPIAFN